MKKTIKLSFISAIIFSFSAELMATEWNASVWGKRRAFTENIEKLTELVEERSDGKFKINISYGGLSKSRENLDGISIGAFEIAQFCSFYHTDKNPTITVTELPFSKPLSLQRISEIYTEIYKQPDVIADLARWNATLLMPTPLPQYNIIGKGESPLELDDFKGKRIRGPGGIMGVLGSLGAVKTTVPFSEVRQAMDSDVIDGAAFAPHAHLATKTYKVGKWATTNLNLGSANCPVVVNTDALNSLSNEHRQILMDAIRDAMAFYIENYDNNITEKYEKTISEQGLQQITFNETQTDALNKLGKDVVEKWIDKHQKQFDAKKLYELTEKLFNQ